ncbi:MAG TPA: ABC transporter ATP-binding protein [Thermoanaerobaculia bacterium]|nr:ABC transporter ATP-binding protein [Thermoanaerobaculia bacterium]
MTESRPAPLLAARGLGWHAGGRRVLGPLDLDVARGESLVVVGPNGAGKTTLLRLLAGLLAPSEGEVRLAGRPLAGHGRKELARRIAYVPQLRPVRVPLSVEAVVLLGRYPYLRPFQLAPAARDLEAVAEALRLVEIEPLRERPVEELSGGERQAVYIAAALAQEAEILVLDEPTTHLDPRHEREIAALLPRLRREAGRTVVTATHDLNFASLTASRLVALKEGRILASGRPAELLEPGLLGELFEAPFEVVRPGERPVTLLRLDAP